MNQFIRVGSVFILAFLLMAAKQQNQEVVSGAVKMRVLDDLATGSHTQFMLDKLILEFKTFPDLWSGDLVEVSGIQEGKKFLVESFELKHKNRRIDGPLDREAMRHTTAILAVSDASVSRNQALNAMDDADIFWNEVTRGFDSLQGGVFEKYNIDYDNSDCSYDNSDNIWERLIDAFENDGYNADNFDHILTIIPRNCGSWTGAWAYIGGIRDNGQLRFAQISMYKDNVFDGSFIAHELGHNIGMNHARSRDCGKNPYYKPSGCQTEEYGNWNDNMGNGGANQDDGVWYSGPYQRYLGWIGAVHVVTAGRTSDFNLLPIDDTFDCGVQALRVPIPDEDGTYFYVEYRHTRGNSINAGTGPTNNKRNSVLITRSQDGKGGNDSSFTDRIELDVNRYDGAQVGENYNLGKGVAVRVQSMGAIAKVSITMPGNSSHRDDNGNQLSPQPDGTFGQIDCGPVVEDPYIEMSKNTYLENEPIVVRYYNLPDSDTNWIAIYNRGAGHDSAIEWQYVQGATGAATFAGQLAGNYDARLFFNDVADLKYEVQFKVKKEDEPPPEYKCKKNVLKEKKKLKPGQYLCSKNDEYIFGLSAAGKLHLVRLSDNVETWTAGICCYSDSFLKMQKDGNLVHYRDNGDVLFASGTQGNRKSRLKMRNTGNAVILDKKKNVIWSTEGDEPPPEDPYIETSKAQYEVDEKIKVNFYNLPSGDLHWIGLFDKGAADEDYLVWEWVRGGSGFVEFDGLSKGNYDARLYFDDSYNVEYEVTFKVKGDDPPPEDPYIEMSKNKYSVGEQIKVLFFNLPDNNFWIGLFNSGAEHDEFLVWKWAQGGTGTVMFDGMSTAGDYDARLFLTDSYDLVFAVTFKVEGDDPPPEGDVDLTLNPYQGVNWDWTQYKANYHAHTERSDGSDHPATVIDDYYDAGYKILAITDHNRITWPWTDYGRDPDSLGMLAVKGDEWSRSHHMNPLHNFSTASSNMEDGIPHLQASNGVGQWNHPLRYSDEDDWDWYVWWAREYPAMVGLEVINGTNTSAKNLWDNMNENFYRTDGRFVWGHANDDSHHSDHIGKGFMFLLMPNLTKAAHLNAMRKGRSYFCVEPGGSGGEWVPKITRIVVDNDAKTIRVVAEGQDTIRWVGPGTQNVGTGPVFDYSDFTNKSFVRVRLDGPYGDCFTQPFGFTTN